MKFSSFSEMQKKTLKDQFKFGLESEYLVISEGSEVHKIKPLWYQDLKFEKLNQIFENIDVSDLPSCNGLDLEPPQTKLMPYVVEGYHLPDMNHHAQEILPKGVEIRTPVCNSLMEVLEVHNVLYNRLQKAMKKDGYDLVCLSHHPIYSEFSGPQNKRRHDYWQWSMEVMTTYGPDINISLPTMMASQISNDDLEAKINYFGPALSALSVASPFVNGSLWPVKDGFGKSYRMHKRSYIAPAIEFHPEENNRYEFKVFDMPSTEIEIEGQFLIFLGMLLDETLTERASKQSRIYDLGQVAKYGLAYEDMTERALKFLNQIKKNLENWGYTTEALNIYFDRAKTGRTPADDLIQLFCESSIDECLRRRKFKSTKL